MNFSEISPFFKEINCEVIGCSIDSAFVHSNWCNLDSSEGGLRDKNKPLKIPLIADIDKEVATKFKAIIDHGEDKGATYRTTVIIDHRGDIRYYSTQDLPIGRNVDEVFRLV